MNDAHERHVLNFVDPYGPNSAKSHVGCEIAARQKMYAASVKDPVSFWCRIAAENFYWKELWPSDDEAMRYNFHKSKGKIFIKWFEGGKTNISYNALDRHLPQHRDRVCYYFEGNTKGESGSWTYGQMHESVVQLAAVLKHHYGISKGDRITLYLPMVPFATQAMLAAARIGAVVSVVFAGFSSRALASRIKDSSSKLIITADGFSRGEKHIPLKKIADEALAECERDGESVKCLVYKRCNSADVVMREGRDEWYHVILDLLTPCQLKDCPIEWMDAEDPLFMLYTSGSTGRPKALLHTTGGYMVYAWTTFRYSFDYHEDDVYFCTADIGWITGHTYVVYGPMLNAATSVLFEGMPMYPTAARWWELVDNYKVSIFYTSPTALRSLMQVGDKFVKQTSRKTLRVLGSVGEPINVEAWKWYYEVVGERHVDICDTWWQTETGGHLVTSLPGCTPMKPGSASLPFFGIVPAILDPMTHEEIEGPGEGLFVMKTSWPGQARTIYGNHCRFEEVYFFFDGFYFSGDGARRDSDGYYWITGRVDDVLNVSGHRIGTSEIEDAVNTCGSVVESAVVGVPHPIKGEGIYVYVTFQQGVEVDDKLLNTVKQVVRQVIGPVAQPDYIQAAQCGLPKTRSGKIVRRILRKIACGNYKDFGDVTTLSDHSVVDKLIEGRQHMCVRI